MKTLKKITPENNYEPKYYLDPILIEEGVFKNHQEHDILIEKALKDFRRMEKERKNGNGNHKK